MKAWKQLLNHPGLLLLLAAGGALAWHLHSRPSAATACGTNAFACGLMAGFAQPWRMHLTANAENETLPVEIAHLAPVPGTDAAMVFLVTADQAWHVPITIGRFEAEAIARAMQAITPARPMTHELLFSLLDALDAKLEKVTIAAFEHQTFKAVMQLRTPDGRTLEIDARPSDSLSLAVHAGAELHISQPVLDRAGVRQSPRDAPPPQTPSPRPRRQPERPRERPSPPERTPDWLI